MKKCINCGKLLEDDVSFCPNCGKSTFKNPETNTVEEIDDRYTEINDQRVYSKGREHFFSNESSTEDRVVPEMLNPVYTKPVKETVVPVPNQQYGENLVPVSNSVNAALVILTILCPLAGIILMFTDKKYRPKTAKVCGIIGIILMILNFLFTSAIGVIAVSKGLKDINPDNHDNDVSMFDDSIMKSASEFMIE